MMNRIKQQILPGFSGLSCAALLLLFLWAGCTSRATDEDWEKNGRVRVVLDWGTRAPHAGVFDYYFYAEGSNSPLVRRGDASGYEGTLPQGGYAVVACNPDGSNLDLSMQKGYAEARAVARGGVSTKAPSSPISQPGNLYGVGLEGIRATATSENPIVMAPLCLTKEVQLNLVIEGAGEVFVVSGELSGVPPEIYLPTGKPCAGRSGTVTFQTRAEGNKRYSATLTVFGLRPGGGEAADPANLSLTVQQKNGQSFTSHTDVTEQITNALTDGLATRLELDLTVQPLAAGGLTIVLTGWRVGDAEAGTDDTPDETPTTK